MRPRRRRRPAWRYALLAAGALLLANAVAFAAFTLPRLQRSRRVAELSSEMRVKLDQERAEHRRLQRRADTLAANQRDAERFLRVTAVPLKDGLVADLTAVEEAVGRAGVPAERQQFKPNELKELPLTRVDFSLGLKGTSGQVAAFLRSVETSPRFLVIDRVALRREKERDRTRMSLDVELSTYYRNQNPAPAASGAPKRR